MKICSPTESDPESIEFWSKFTGTFSSTHSEVCINIWSTSQVDFSSHSRYMDKPSWCPINREKFKRICNWNVFVTTPVTFYFNFLKNHDFWWSRQGGDDPGKNILNLMCSNGPGWWVGAQGCLERALETSRSNLRSKTV